jgi:hypothetical protein
MRRIVSPTWSTSRDKPRNGSSSMMKRGRLMRARPMATICCSPPDSVCASCDCRSRSAGNMASTLSSISARAGREARLTIGRRGQPLVLTPEADAGRQLSNRPLDFKRGEVLVRRGRLRHCAWQTRQS